MAGRQPTLAEISLRQQVRAANRVAFRRWFQGGVSPAAYWLMAIVAVVVAASAVAWRYFA